mmetsp:Transcript_38839/g.103105  ORF Transcript_38839/g.103105 Transcript_38839/m.103105 type:complete len:313 (-) Transcript_38839:97-1035(-)
MHSRKTRPLDQIVDFPDSHCPWELAQPRVEVRFLLFKEAPQVFMLELLIPERPHEHAAHLRRIEHLSQGPHQGTVHTQKLLCVYAVSFVEDGMNLGVVAPASSNHAPKLIGNVQLRNVEQEKDHICTVRKPLDDTLEVVAALETLLLSREHSRRVYEREALEHRARESGSLQASKEVVPEVRQLSERQRCIDHKSVARGRGVGFSVEHGNKPVCGGFGTNPKVRVVAPQKVSDEGALPRRVLPEQQHHRCRTEVCICQFRGVELVEQVFPLKWQHLLLVDALQLPLERSEIVQIRVVPFVLFEPSHHGACPQ